MKRGEKPKISITKSEEKIESIEIKWPSVTIEDQISVQCEVFGVTDQVHLTWLLNGENVNYFVEETEIFPVTTTMENYKTDILEAKRMYFVKQTIRIKQQVRMDKGTLQCIAYDLSSQVYHYVKH